MRDRLKWAGHVERKGSEKLAKRADSQKFKENGRRGIPGLQWEDCVKRDLWRVGEEWRTTAQIEGIAGC